MPSVPYSLLCGVLLLPFRAAAPATAASPGRRHPLGSLEADVRAGDCTATVVPGARRTIDLPVIWNPSEEPSQTRVERVEVVPDGLGGSGTRRRLAPGCDYSAIFDVTFSPSPAPATEVRQAEAATEEALCMWADVFEPGSGGAIRLRIDPVADFGEPPGSFVTTLARAAVQLLQVRFTFGSGDQFVLDETPAQIRYAGILSEEEFDQLGVEFDGDIVFNRAVDWHYGDGADIGELEFDYVTVMAHEIGHVLGFTNPLLVLELTTGEAVAIWNEYFFPNGDSVDNYFGSRFSLAMTAGLDGPILSPFTFPTSLDLVRGTVTPNFIFTADTLCILDEPTGTCVPIYTPFDYNVGSSMSHFDESFFRAGSVDSLMTSGAQESEVARCVGALTQRVFEQLGYVLSTDCRSTCASLITGETDPLDASCSSGGGAPTTPAPVTSTTTSSPSTPAPAAPITGGERDNDLTPAPADANPAPGGLTTPAPAPITGGERDNDLTPAPVDQQQGEQGSADATPAPVGLTTPAPAPITGGDRDTDLTPAPVEQDEQGSADATPAPVGLTTPAPAPITGGDRDTDLTPAPVEQDEQGSADATPAPVGLTTPAPAPITGGDRDTDLTPAPVEQQQDEDEQADTPSGGTSPTPAPASTFTTPAPAPITGGDRDIDLTPAPMAQDEQGAADATTVPVGLTTPAPSSAAAGGGGGGGGLPTPAPSSAAAGGDRGLTTAPTEAPVASGDFFGQNSAGSSVSSNGLSALTLALCVSLASTLLVSHTHMSTWTL